MISSWQTRTWIREAGGSEHPSERLEATVWLDATYPEIPAEQRTAFDAAVDDYYEQHPIAARQPHALDILKQDNRAFAEILRNILREGQAPPDDEVAPSVS